MKVIEIIKDALTLPMKSRSAKKFFFILFLLQMITGLIYTLIYIQFFGETSFPGCISCQIVSGDMTANIIELNFSLFPLYLVYSFAAFFIYLLVMKHALEKLGFETKKITLKKFASITVVLTASFFSALFSLFEKKFLLIPLLLVLLILADGTIALSGEIAFFVAIFILLVTGIYGIVFLRNSSKLVLSIPAAIIGDLRTSDYLKLSWRMTKNKAKEIAGAFFAIILLTGIILFALNFLLGFAGEITASFAGNLAGAAIFSLGSATAYSLFAIWSNYLIALIFEELKQK